MKKKYTITGILITIIGLGGSGSLEAIEMSKEYSVDQIKLEQVKPNYGSKRAEIMSKVFIARENIVIGKRKFKKNGYTIEVKEKKVVKNGGTSVLKIVVSSKNGNNVINFKPFWYVNPPVSNKECTDANMDEEITYDECVYDYDTDSVLKQIIWDSMIAQQPNILTQ